MPDARSVPGSAERLYHLLSRVVWDFAPSVRLDRYHAPSVFPEPHAPMELPGVAITQARIRASIERIRDALRNRPTIGVGTARTRIHVTDGFRCVIEDGAWTLHADIGPKAGGAGTAPDPGVLGRSALGACLAMTYVRWAALLEVPIDDVEVEIEADYDARGEYGLTDDPPGYTGIRYAVSIRSPADSDAVARLVDQADAHCAWLFVVRDRQSVQRTAVHHTFTR